MEIQSKSNPLEVIKIKEFKNLLIGRFVFISGLRMMGTLVGWWIYELTKDPLAIGLVGLAEVIPALSFSLYAGHIIDISDKRKLMLTGVSLYGLCAILLFSFSYMSDNKMISNSTVAICIYSVIFITGIIRAFTGPTFHAMLAQIVPKNLLANATTWNSGTWLSASVVGHASAGFLIAGIHNSGTLLTVIVFVIISFFIMFQLHPKPADISNLNKKTWESVKQGLRFVYNTKEILGALSLDLFAVLFGGAVALVPVYAKDILHIGPIGFGWLNAAADIGSILIIVYLTFKPLLFKQGKIMMIAVAAFGLCMILFGISKIFWLSFAALLISGIVDGISMVIRGTILQLKTPNEMRGRVMSVNSMFINSSNELGQFESGVAAKILGVVPSVVFGGCMTIIVVVTTWFKAPKLRELEY